MGKSLKIITSTWLLCIFLNSCNGGKIEKLTNERDSISHENERLNEFLDIVAISFDSINGQEQYLYRDKEGRLLSNKEQIRNNIRLFKYTLEEQKKRIKQLEEQLANSDNEQSRRLRSLIKTLQKQIAEKDTLIARLNIQLEKKNADIRELSASVEQLSSNVGTLKQQVNQLSEENEQKDEDLRTANEEVASLSTGYVIIGTKKELSSLGIVSGGLFKKKKINYNNLDNSNYTKIDTRNVNEINIPGKNAKLISNNPSSSYTIEDEGSSCVLHITNKNLFWSTGKYIVIQVKK